MPSCKLLAARLVFGFFYFNLNNILLMPLNSEVTCTSTMSCDRVFLVTILIMAKTEGDPKS